MSVSKGSGYEGTACSFTGVHCVNSVYYEESMLFVCAFLSFYT